MPYIDPKKRPLYDDYISAFGLMHAEKTTAGELTYLLTALIHKWIQKQKWCYLTFCIAIGVLFCTALELYMTVIRKYENKKRRENGPVSELDSKSLEDVR
jgi:hypothetical protein